MGKVLFDFYYGVAGAISRSYDERVITLMNMDTNPIEFGAAVVLSSDRKGVKNVASDAANLNDFVGVAARVASRTPNEYGANTAKYYDKGDPVGILVEGSVVVSCEGSGIARGKPVYFNPSTGKFTAVTSDMIAVPNANFRTMKDPNGCAEIVIRTSNLQ